MSPVYVLDRTALLKILLHSIKYPSASVNGILLADKQANDQTVTVVDAVPVLHSFLTLAPALETALIQVISLSPRFETEAELTCKLACPAIALAADSGICKAARLANHWLLPCK